MDHRHLPVFCLLLAWATAMLGFFIGVGGLEHLFARFGSLVVLFALIGEFSLLRAELTRLYERLGHSEDDLVHTRDFTPSKWHRKKTILLHLTVVGGTLIWGFGDLLIG